MEFRPLLRKYGPGLTLMILFALLIFFLIPAQERHYGHQELKIISRKTLQCTLLLSFLGGFLIWFFIVRKKWEGRKDMLLLVMLLLQAAFLGFFVIKVFFYFGGLALNRIMVKKTREHAYSYSSISSDKETIYLFDNDKKEVIWYDHLSGAEKLSGVEGPRTVKLKTKIGLFGWESDPEIQTVLPLK